MQIPTLYVLLAAELIVLLALGVGLLLFYVLRLRKRLALDPPLLTDIETQGVSSGISYVEYLQQELERNSHKSAQQQRIEEEQASETDPPASSAGTPHSALLQARNLFLSNEKAAAQQADNENLFWDQIYAGMKNIVKTFRVIEHDTHVVTEEVVAHKTTTKEKVFYIETQGKKVDGEVNKLKDIIYDQENTLSSLKKALSRSVEHEVEESEEIAELRQHIDSFERQLKDSKVCMEVLELENERLQHELHALEARQSAPASTEPSDDAGTGIVSMAQMREVLEKQERQMQELHQAIDELKLESGQSDRIKKSIREFTRTGQEMMGCITILEEENEHLKQQVHELEDHVAVPAGNEDIEQYQLKLKELEQAMIKKDVDYARLQDEFSAMEKEYLAMYKALHGDD